MNVILFDIDGTLILTDRAGQKAMERVVPANGAAQKKTGDVDYAGRTDRSIVADHLRRLGMEDSAENFRQYTQDFLERLPESLSARNGFVLPGVLELLQSLSRCATTHLGLLTGNLRSAARMKLAHFQLDEFFLTTGEFVGGFGDEHHDRDDVAKVALAESRRHFDENVDPQQVWIVGDTPRDVQCARAIGANALAVATGSYSEDALAAAEPDLLCKDLAGAKHWWQRLRDSNAEL